VCRGTGRKPSASPLKASLPSMRFTPACEICHLLPEMLPDAVLTARIALKWCSKLLVFLVNLSGFEPETY